MHPIARIIYLFIIFALLAGCASQRDVLILDQRLRTMENRNRELQQQQETMQKRLDSETAQLAAARQTAETDLRTQYAGMGAGMERLQQELRLLGGRMEEVEHTLQRRLKAEPVDQDPKADERLDAVTAIRVRLEQRVEAIEHYLGLRAPGVSTTPEPAAADPAAREKLFEAGLPDKELYARAKQAFDDGRMDLAREGFDLLLKRFPQSDLANNAQFWIGESHYRERWFEKAILEYQTVIEKYPRGNKVPAAMLKQGLAFLQLGDEANARLVLNALQQQFPQSSEAKVAANRLKEL